jgi:hypothetical protein
MVTVTCPACQTTTTVRSRRGFSNFDDTHQVSCQTRIEPTEPDLDVLLDLPPDDHPNPEPGHDSTRAAKSEPGVRHPGREGRFSEPVL